MNVKHNELVGTQNVKDNTLDKDIVKVRNFSGRNCADMNFIQINAVFF